MSDFDSFVKEVKKIGEECGCVDLIQILNSKKYLRAESSKWREMYFESEKKIEKMKSCHNCKNKFLDICSSCFRNYDHEYDRTFDKWELKDES